MPQEAAPNEIDALLARANGRRRARTLSRNDVEMLVAEASASPTGVAFRHGGQSDARARTSLCLVVVEETKLTAGLAEVSAQDADPGRAWAELRPWNPSVLEANVSRARAWAARKKPDRVSWPRVRVTKTGGDGLLEQVRERPRDDEPRLVYADFLSEKGDPRGELISVQCRRAKLEAQTGRPSRELRSREQQLLESDALKKRFSPWLGFEWAPQVIEGGAALAQGQGHHGVDSLLIARGFVETVTAQASKLSGLGELMAAEPVVRLNVYAASPGDGARIAAMPGLSQIRLLHLAGIGGIQPEGLSLLLESRELKSLDVLELQGQGLGDTGTLLLVARGPEVLPSLRGLAVMNDELSLASLATLRPTRWCRRLKVVTLDDVRLQPGAVDALVTGAPVDWQVLALNRNSLTAADVRPIFSSPALAALKLLSLDRNNITNVAAWLSSKLLLSLERLSLTGNPLSDSAKSVLRARLGERVVLD